MAAGNCPRNTIDICAEIWTSSRSVCMTVFFFSSSFFVFFIIIIFLLNSCFKNHKWNTKSSLIQKCPTLTERRSVFHIWDASSGIALGQKKMIEPARYWYELKLHILHHSPGYCKHISVHLRRKSNFLKSSTFLSFRCPKRNVRNAVQILLLVSDHKRGNNVWGFPLVRSHKLATCTQEIPTRKFTEHKYEWGVPYFPLSVRHKLHVVSTIFGL